MNYFANSLDDIYKENASTLNSYTDHIIFQKTKCSTRGYKVGFNIDLDAALAQFAANRTKIPAIQQIVHLGIPICVLQIFSF